MSLFTKSGAVLAKDTTRPLAESCGENESPAPLAPEDVRLTSVTLLS